MQDGKMTSSESELVMLIKQMTTFEIVLPNDNDVVIPTTTKFWVKLKANGTVEKLKVRI